MVWLLLLLEILGDICIVIICFLLYDNIFFENTVDPCFNKLWRDREILFDITKVR